MRKLTRHTLRPEKVLLSNVAHHHDKNEKGSHRLARETLQQHHRNSAGDCACKLPLNLSCTRLGCPKNEKQPPRSQRHMKPPHAPPRWQQKPLQPTRTNAKLRYRRLPARLKQCGGAETLLRRARASCIPPLGRHQKFASQYQIQCQRLGLPRACIAPCQ